MFLMGQATSVDFVPSEETRTWIATGLSDLVSRLGESTQKRRSLSATPSKAELPRDLDGLFEFVCDVQNDVDQSDIEFALVELEHERPSLPPGFEPLGQPQGQLLHTFHHAGEYAMVFVPGIFRVSDILLASVARELGRIAIHRGGGHSHELEPADYEADAELGAVALGLGVWITNGAYVFENACCGGGCGIDLKTLKTGLSMPESAFALALDGQRRGLSRREVGKALAPTQKAAFKANWKACERQPALQRLAAATTARLHSA